MSRGGEVGTEQNCGRAQEPSVPLDELLQFMDRTDTDVAGRVATLEQERPDIFADAESVNRAIATTSFEAGRRSVLAGLANLLIDGGYLPSANPSQPDNS